MKQKQINFRLSEQALKNLQTICWQSGSNQTAAVEMALAHFAAQFTKGDDKMDAQNEILDYLGSEYTEEMLRADFGGKDYQEILATLNQWFPSDNNERLAKKINEYLR